MNMRFLALFLTLKGKKHSYFIVRPLGFSEMPWIRFSNFLSILSFLEVFIMSGCWILSNAFSSFIEMIMSSPYFVTMMNCTDWFLDFRPIWHSSDKYHLGIFYPFTYCWIQFTNILLEILHLCSNVQKEY